MAPAQWYYYLQNDPRGLLPDGWYEYDPPVNQQVEQLYQREQSHHSGSKKRARQLVPMTASSGFQYELDFQRMVQRNAVSGKERPIGRTTNGLPPHQQRQARAAISSTGGAVAANRGTAHQSNGNGANHRQRNAHIVREAWNGGEKLTYAAPEKLHEVHLDEKKVFVDVENPIAEEKKQADSTSSNNHDYDCVICLESLWKPSGKQERVVALKGCLHQYHYNCIHDALKNSSTKCPLCSKVIASEPSQTAKGRCPSGSMTVTTNPKLTCEGHAPGTLQITYNIHSGIQKSYHPHPGETFQGAHRIAYLPNNLLGQQLLPRMQYAFCHGLSFMVGTSLTTSQPNVVTWASIHHKTSLTGGTQRFGYPDDSYFDRCNSELDGLGVPDSATCLQWIQNL